MSENKIKILDDGELVDIDLLFKKYHCCSNPNVTIYVLRVNPLKTR